MDSNGRRDTVEIVLENRGDSVFRCTYIPVLQGAHTVYVTFAGQQIPKSPFTVHISEGSLVSFQIFVLPQSLVLVNAVVQHEGQNYSTSGSDLVCCWGTSLSSSGSWGHWVQSQQVVRPWMTSLTLLLELGGGPLIGSCFTSSGCS